MIKRMLDLYCGGGGAAMGYYRAFGPNVEIIGVDIRPQPRYPFAFIQADALEFMRDGRGDGFDFYHASPPCQRFSVITALSHKKQHPDLIQPTRVMLRATGKPYVIENVEGARRKLICPVMLCGSMFGLPLRRHRYFELWPPLLLLTPSCNHARSIIYVTGSTGRSGCGFRRRDATIADKQQAMGIDWMVTSEIDEAIPPAYTEWIGRQILDR